MEESLVAAKFQHETKLESEAEKTTALPEEPVGEDIYLTTWDALSDGLSDPDNPGQPTHRALTSGALNVAVAMFRVGASDADLQPLADLWKGQSLKGTDPIAAAEQLFGEDGEKITYPTGTSLASFTAALLAKVRQTADLKAAYHVIKSVQAKLALFEVNASGKKASA